MTTSPAQQRDAAAPALPRATATLTRSQRATRQNRCGGCGRFLCYPNNHTSYDGYTGGYDWTCGEWGSR